MSDLLVDSLRFCRDQFASAPESVAEESMWSSCNRSEQLCDECCPFVVVFGAC